MSAGTLTLTNNSAAVAGNGTAFTTEVAAGDFIVVTVGGVPYTLPIKSVESGTALMLVSNFTGPTQSGAAWSAVPRVALNMVTAALVAQSAEALRGLNYDKQNWQQVFSGTGNVTVRLPDGSSFTGPAWNDITSALSGKADKFNGVVQKEQGGTGLSSPFGSSENTFCQGNDSRLNTVDSKSGGLLTSKIVFNANSHSKGITVAALPPANFSELYTNNEQSALSLSPDSVTIGSFYPEFTDKHYVTGKYAGVYYRGMIHTNSEPVVHHGYASEGGIVSSHVMQYRPGSGMLYVSGSVTSPVISQTSDRDCKGDIAEIDEALEKISKIRGVTFNWVNSGMPSSGVIAQEVKEILPECIAQQYGENGERFFAVEYAGVIALCVQAIRELKEKVNALES